MSPSRWGSFFSLFVFSQHELIFFDLGTGGNLTLPEFVSISYSPTDGCETGSFESLSQWQDRVVRDDLCCA